ncbi:histidine kinase dimerization/phospho-acceptor domain-containing protein [Streptosporangium sp. NPDC049644]|uniref:sensor histidine kinase n=1 Tax=Streptosporangium sp. NPDC049644 TaxID=3155507 RepID=UPI00341EC8A2
MTSPHRPTRGRGRADHFGHSCTRLRKPAFTSDASHDLRGPPAAMRLQIDEALAYPQETDWPRTANALLDSVERLQNLVTDLLRIARLDAGVSGRHDPIDLTGLIKNRLKPMRYQPEFIAGTGTGLVLSEPP